MRNLKELRKHMEILGNPGVRIVDTILEVSNSPEFILDQAKLIQEAAQADIDESRDLRNRLLDSMRDK